MAGVFAAVVGLVIGSAYWMTAPTYAPLYTDLDQESASAVVTQLKTAKVPYVIDDGGRTVRVPAERLDELRLSLASQSLPNSGRIGFEIFDRTAFGTTDFLEHVNYRRALEGELARTIGTLGEVASARVHIALAKDSLFASEDHSAKASVVLRLRRNRPLAPATVQAITGLVASSVESLRPEAVVVLDTFGRPLTHREPDDAGGLAASPSERQQNVERDLTRKVVDLLDPVVGPGHARVNVSARFKNESEEETEERWDPTSVVRSRQATSDVGPGTSSGGIAGARANLPAGASTAGTAQSAAMPLGRTSETTNYEISKLTRHRIAPRGDLSRLSVAVIVDDERATAKDARGRTRVTNKPRNAEDLQRIQKLVAAAVGLDPERGDQLTVENIAFSDMGADPLPPEPGWSERFSDGFTSFLRTRLLDVLRMVGVLVIGILAILLVLKPMAQRAMTSSPQLAVVAPTPLVSGKSLDQVEREIESQLDAERASSEVRRLPVLTRRVNRAVEESPEHVARLVRSWLNEEET